MCAKFTRFIWIKSINDSWYEGHFFNRLSSFPVSVSIVTSSRVPLLQKIIVKIQNNSCRVFLFHEKIQFPRIKIFEKTETFRIPNFREKIPRSEKVTNTGDFSGVFLEILWRSLSSISGISPFWGFFIYSSKKKIRMTRMRDPKFFFGLDGHFSNFDIQSLISKIFEAEPLTVVDLIATIWMTFRYMTQSRRLTRSRFW